MVKLPLTLALLAGLLIPAHNAQAQSAQPQVQAIARASAVKAPPKIQIAILLDTSGSMDGLLSQAKSELWSIINRFGEASLQGVRPDIEVAIYEYGSGNITEEEGYMRMVSPLTGDLDQISERLFSLHTSGSEEYAGTVIKHSTGGLQWSTSPQDYRAIYIAGNEEFTQGPTPYQAAIGKAVGKGIVVNTIHCGSVKDGIDGKWRHAAELGGGSFLTIEQNHRVLQIATPYDKELAALSAKINKTYVAYGRLGRKKEARQSAEDSNASAMGSKSMASRARAKGSRSYKNATWDLVDLADAPGKLEKIKKAQLPKLMQGMNMKERRAYVAKKAIARKAIQKSIATLAAKRALFVEAERKKLKKDKTSTFEKAMLKAIDTQLKRKGFKFEK